MRVWIYDFKIKEIIFLKMMKLTTTKNSLNPNPNPKNFQKLISLFNKFSISKF